MEGILIGEGRLLIMPSIGQVPLILSMSCLKLRELAFQAKESWIKGLERECLVED